MLGHNLDAKIHLSNQIARIINILRRNQLSSIFCMEIVTTESKQQRLLLLIELPDVPSHAQIYRDLLDLVWWP